MVGTCGGLRSPLPQESSYVPRATGLQDVHKKWVSVKTDLMSASFSSGLCLKAES